jgi:putative oxidoreductase
MMNKQLGILSHLCALGVAGAFVYASSLKIWEPRQFAMDITNYRILPESLANLLAILLPWWELAAAIALIIPSTRKAGAVLVSGMLLMFICAVSYSALYKGLHIDCGCFGKDGSAMAGWKTIGFDVFLLAATAGAVWCLPRGRSDQANTGFPVEAVSQTA